MALKRIADDVVGRFRSDHRIDDRPAARDEWRITTGDPEVADKVHELLGGQAPREWATKGEDSLEVLTASTVVAIIIENAKALRQRMVFWGRSGKLIYESNGEFVFDGHGLQIDPDIALSIQTRAVMKVGPVPDVELCFRLADAPELGVFAFKTASWSFVSDLAYNGVGDALEVAEGPSAAVLKLAPVSFVARNGARKGETVRYAKCELVLKDAAPVKASAGHIAVPQTGHR